MRKNQTGAIGAVEIALVSVLVLFIGFVVWRIAEAETETNDSAAAATIASDPVAPPSSIEEASPSVQTSQPAAGEEALVESFEEITLEAVNDYDASGTATRAYNGEQFVHEVIMQAPDPAEGKFYEGWIVGPSVISTGELTSEGDGQWSLTYTSTEDLRTHSRVVITEETSANGLDGIPETHVLEGNF